MAASNSNSMEAKNTSLTLSEEEENGIIIDDDDIAEAIERYKYVLVGKLLTDKPINFDKMKDKIASIWRPVMGMCVSQVYYNLFVFQLFHERDLNRIIEDGPWSFKQGLLVLKRLSVYESPYDVTLTKADFWVQIHKIPLGFFSEKIAEVIGASIGDFLHVDKKNFDGTWKPFMRIRVALDTTKPLKRKMKIKEGGKWIWVEFKYERLPTFCYLCGIIGHGDRFCPKLYEIEAEKEAERPYGAWLRTTRRGKKWLAGQQWLVSGPPPRSETQNTVEKDSSAGVEQTHVCETKNTMEKDSSAGVEQTHVEDFVKDVGEVKDVGFASHPDGAVKGVGHVEFATSEASEKDSDEEEDEASEEYSDEEEDEDYSGEEDDEESEEYSDEEEDEASEEFSDEEEDEPSKTPEKITPVTSTAEAQGGSNTIFMGNLSWSIEEGDVEDFFKDVGEVKEIRLALHPDGTSRGFGHVEFATSEAAVKALELNGQRLLGRGVKLDFAIERVAYTRNSGKYDNSSQEGRSEGGGESTTVFVRGFDTNDTEDKIWCDLKEHFGHCGKIKDIRIPTDSEGCIRGMAYIEFMDSLEMKTALQLNNSQIGNYSLYVDEAKPRGWWQCGGGFALPNSCQA